MRYLVISLVVLTFAVFPVDVLAQSCTSTPRTCDAGEASSAARTEGVKCTSPNTVVADVTLVHDASIKTYKASYNCRLNGNVFQSGMNGFTQFYGNDCSSRNATYPPGNQTGSAVPIPRCYGGCEVLGTETKYAVGGINLYGMSDRYYSGQVCSARVDANAPIDAAADQRDQATENSQPECTAVGGGQTACMKPNGDYCATASTGKTFCWTPNQEGAQVDGDQAQVKGETGKPVKPPDVSVPDKDWQRKEGHQAQACVNGTCKTYNVTNYGTVPSGTAKNSTGDNSADGTGNTSGNGKGNGKEGDGDDSDGDSATDSGNCDAAPSCTGDTLKCLHLKFTWKIQCNTQGVEIDNGNGCGEGDVPVCAGKSCKAGEYAQVLQQWKQRCALEALAAGNATRAQSISNGDDQGVVDSIWITPDNNGLTLRQDLVTVAGGGSLLPDVEIEGQSWTVPQGFYDAIAAIRFVIVAMCTVMAMFIVGRNI